MDEMEAIASREPYTAPSRTPLRDLETAFREHSTMVYRAACRITGNAEDAEDVLQTVFLRLARREDSAEEVGHVPGYLRKAAVNAALDLMRSRQRARLMPLEEVEPILPQDSVQSPERVYHATEMR